MQKILSLIFFIAMLSACANSDSQDTAQTETAVASDETSSESEANESETYQEETSGEEQEEAPEEKYEEIENQDETLGEGEEIPEELEAFVPAGSSILGFKYGDLNKDARKEDALIVLKDNLEEEGEKNRPLLILIRQEDGSLQKVAENNYAVYCYACGGVLGDPFQDLAIKNGYFSVEHFGGSRYKWVNITTFKYNKEKDDWFLHKFGSESYDGFNPDDVEKKQKTTKDFGQIRFEDFVDVN